MFSVVKKAVNMKQSIRIFPTPKDLAVSLALDLVSQIKEAETSVNTFTIALSGGSTPRLLFSILAEKFARSVNWSNVHFFWVDERCVPPDDPESNFGMTNDVFLSRINIPENNIHRIRGEEDPGAEALRYSKEISDFTEKRNGIPCFSIMLLGLGEDGHTASIFPGNEKLFMAESICTTAAHPVTRQVRITLTGKVINNSDQIIFLVTGKNKSGIVSDIIGQGDNIKLFPASYVKPDHGKIKWYMDENAGL